VREKVLAAQRAGLKRVILPRENEHDLDDLPPETKEELDFVLVDGIDEVLAHALTPSLRTRRARGTSLERQAASPRQ
jgi:ATP-dependent Lon protease